MSGSTDALIYTDRQGNTRVDVGAAALMASVLFPPLAVAGGVAIVGAGVFAAARKMHQDFAGAMHEYHDRCGREKEAARLAVCRDQAAVLQARGLAQQLSQKAIEDPNTLFLISGLTRLKHRVTGTSGPDGPLQGAQELIDACQKLLDEVATVPQLKHFLQFTRLSARVEEWNRSAIRLIPRGSEQEQLVAQVRAALQEFAKDLEEVAHFSPVSPQLMTEMVGRLSELTHLAATEPAVALQGLELLEERWRSTLQDSRRAVAQQTQSSEKLRVLVGEISARAQAVLGQEHFPEAREAAQILLKRLSLSVGATPVVLEEVEALHGEAEKLFQNTEEGIAELAIQEHLQDQVAQVLGGLGYRVTEAGNAPADSRMVAVLNSDLGVQLKVDGKGNLSGEMVAFSEQASEVDEQQQERVCDLMDAIYDGLRRRNLKIREKKRKNYKTGKDKIKVVAAASRSGENSLPAQATPVAKSLETPGTM